MKMEDVKTIIFSAKDIETLENGNLLIVLEKRSILFTKINSEIKNKCYEIFYSRFIKNDRESSYSSRKIEWSESEKEYLKKNYLNLNINELEKQLNKSKYQINLKMSELQLLLKREWTKEEIEYLKNNLDRTSTFLAGELKRSVASIKSKKRVIMREVRKEI